MRISVAAADAKWRQPFTYWPLQDILLLLVVCARISRSYILSARLHCPHCCNTIACLLDSILPYLRPPFCMPDTIHYWQ